MDNKEEESKEEDNQMGNKRRRKQRRGQSAPSCLSSSLLPSFVVYFLDQKKTISVKSTCVLLFPCVSSHW